ncbi:MAG: biotin--[acetyl-CoA-carboxylase] ligase [Rikenellaceae bacterium]|jgi:BirA family biotin operon repressor/biotin-[acetyl-CoA-carboxylase] ligase|nr:biotin--[acetyl-CoA-carboxylase] ligase [Rikenellaceae bacterium]
MFERLEKLNRLAERLSLRVDYFDRLPSTNDHAARPEYSAASLVWAEEQTQGRGQRGNSWSSRGGENLTFSLVVHPENLRAEHQFYLSKAVSVALVEALAAFSLTATVKWPNDIYIGDRKVAGILIENDLQGARITKSIIGIGLNVNQLLFDPALPNPVSMRTVADRPFDRIEVLEQVIERLLYRTRGNFEKSKILRYAPSPKCSSTFSTLRFCLGRKPCLLNFWKSPKNGIDEKYSQSLYRGRGIHQFREPGGEPFEASIEAVRPDGELILRKTDGTRKGYLFKEIEFVL